MIRFPFHIRYVLLGMLAFALFGCSSAPKTPQAMTDGQSYENSVPAPEVQGPPEAYGPAPAPTYGPEPERSRPVVLVLSPGMARGYAHAGVIRTLVEKSVPIGGIVGAEMGSLVGALYALDPNLNRLEWSMMRFEKEVFAKKGLLAAVFPGAAGRLEAELGRTFSARDISDAGLPLRIAVRVKGTSAPTAVGKGPAAEVLRAALAAEGFVAPVRWEDGEAVSANRSWEVLIEEARALKIGPVVVVNATGEPLPAGARPDLLLSPDLKGLGNGDFDKRTEFAFRGSKAALDALPRLRQLTGDTERTGH